MKKKQAEIKTRSTTEQVFNVKVVGVPLQIGEDDKTEPNNKATLAIISKIAEGVDIQHFTPKQIDVCHRVGNDKYSPIIIRFKKKDDRMKFFNQRKKLYDKVSDDFKLDAPAGNAEDKRRYQEHVPYVKFKESLTNYNAELLRLAKEKSKELDYKGTTMKIRGTTMKILS